MTGAVPRFSIIVPAYNAADYISQTLASVVYQTETEWELIVVDDGSTDSTAATVRQFDDHRTTLIRQENRGVSAARNSGFAKSRGEYVLFLDADDLLFPNSLRRLGQELDCHPEAVLAFGTCTRFERTPPLESAARAPLRARPKPGGDALASLLRANMLLVGGVLARREAIVRIDGFDPELKMGEDWVFWCDLAALGPVRYVGPMPVFAYRSHRSSTTRKLSEDPRGLWPAIDRAFAREAVRQRFSKAELARLRRRAEAFALGVASRELLRNSDWSLARQVLWDGLKRDPCSIGDWVFLLFAMCSWLPKPAQRLVD